MLSWHVHLQIPQHLPSCVPAIKWVLHKWLSNFPSFISPIKTPFKVIKESCISQLCFCAISTKQIHRDSFLDIKLMAYWKLSRNPEPHVGCFFMLTSLKCLNCLIKHKWLKAKCRALAWMLWTANRLVILRSKRDRHDWYSGWSYWGTTGVAVNTLGLLLPSSEPAVKGLAQTESLRGKAEFYTQNVLRLQQPIKL